MKSKEPLEYLMKNAITFFPRDNDCLNNCFKCYKEIKKELEILEILKKYIYFSTKSGCIRMKDICKSSNNFDYEDLKEWLENA